MAKLIALQSARNETVSDAWISNFSNLKQKALLFDQIGIYKLTKFYEVLEETLGILEKLDTDLANKAKTINSELKWLEQTDIIFELFVEKEFNGPLDREASIDKFGNIKHLFNRVIDIQKESSKSKKQSQKIDLLKEQDVALLQILSIVMETTRGVTAVTTSPYDEMMQQFPNSQKSIVSQIVINNLPLPNNETSWEQIFDYRQDSENQKSLLDLRRWIRKTSTENLSPIEIEEELEWLTNEFQRHMKLHKMKANTETLEVIVKTPFEVIENLLGLKFSKLAEPLFFIKKRQINLMEAELNAPGREISYIIKTKAIFHSENNPRGL